MQLGTLKKGDWFRVTGWQNGPDLMVWFPSDDPFELCLHRRGGDYIEMRSKHFVLATESDMTVNEILETTYMLPGKTEVELIN